MNLVDVVEVKTKADGVYIVAVTSINVRVILLKCLSFRSSL